MSTTQRITRVSVEDIQRARGGGNRRRNNFRRRNRSNSRDGEQKLVLRDRKLAPLIKPKNENRARPRGRGNFRERRFADSSPSSSQRDRQANFNQSTVWEYPSEYLRGTDRSDQQAMPMTLMQIPISSLAMGQNSNQLNVPAYCMVMPDTFQQQQQPGSNSFVQQQQDHSSLPMQFTVPVNSFSNATLNNNQREISLERQHDRNIVMEATRSTSSHDKPSARYSGEPVGHDAIIHVPYCRACSEYIPRERDLESHLRSEKHFRHCFDVEPEPVAVNDDPQDYDLLETQGRARYDSPSLLMDDRQRTGRGRDQTVMERRELIPSLLELEQESFFIGDARLVRDDEARNYRQQSPLPSSSNRGIMESRSSQHGVDDRGDIDRIYRRPLLATPPPLSRPVQQQQQLDNDEDAYDQENYYRRFEPSPVVHSPTIDNARHRNDRHESSSFESRGYRRNSPPQLRSLPAAPPPPILRQPARIERTEIEFNAPKVMSRDWGKGGNKRGDYGQTFDINERRGSNGNQEKQCTVCGLKGYFDLRSHMHVAHKMQT